MIAAVAQLISTPTIATNTKICCSLIRKAAKSGAKIVYLPEASDFIAPSATVLSLTTSLESSPFVDGIREEAKLSKIYVGVGIHESSNESKRIYNSHLLIDDNGQILANYRKLHLFDVDIKGGMKVKESATTVPGDKLEKPLDTPFGKLGFLTCYDLRFPEQSLLLRKLGANVLAYPSAFTPKTGEAHWESLLRARAIETQCYVFAPAQGPGEHFPSRIVKEEDGTERIQPGRASYGNALIIDPFGTIVGKCPQISTSSSTSTSISSNPEELGQLCFANIDLNWLEQIRQEMPLWEQRRYDIYDLVEKDS